MYDEKYSHYHQEAERLATERVTLLHGAGIK